MIHAYIRLMILMCIPLQQSIMHSKLSNFQKAIDCKLKTSYCSFQPLKSQHMPSNTSQRSFQIFVYNNLDSKHALQYL
jgi:hypothetical protein